MESDATGEKETSSQFSDHLVIPQKQNKYKPRFTKLYSLLIVLCPGPKLSSTFFHQSKRSFVRGRWGGGSRDRVDPKKDESKSQEMASPLLVLGRREADAHKVLTRITSIRLHRYHQSDYSQVGTRQQLLKLLLIKIYLKTPQS